MTSFKRRLPFLRALEHWQTSREIRSVLASCMNSPWSSSTCWKTASAWRFCLITLAWWRCSRRSTRTARPLFEESLAILREIGYRWAVGQLLNNLGLVLRYLGEIDQARELLEESVEVRRALGDNWGVANSLSSLSNLLLHQGIFDGVREFLEESLKINAELGDRTAIAYCIEDFASLAAANGQPESALRLAGAAQAIREETGSPLPHGEQAALDRTLAPAREALDETSQAAAWEAGQAMTLEAAIAFALRSISYPLPLSIQEILTLLPKLSLAFSGLRSCRS